MIRVDKLFIKSLSPILRVTYTLLTDLQYLSVPILPAAVQLDVSLVRKDTSRWDDIETSAIPHSGKLHLRLPPPLFFFFPFLRVFCFLTMEPLLK